MLQRLKRLIGRRKRSEPMTGAEHFELLAARIGLTLLACQLLERNLQALLRNLFGESEFAAEGRHRMLGEMTRKLGAQGADIQDFIKALDDFRATRNEFVHRLLNTEGGDVTTPEGRTVYYMKAKDVHERASALLKVMFSSFRYHYTRLGYEWPETVEASPEHFFK
jgi:hypothetical protein